MFPSNQLPNGRTPIWSATFAIGIIFLAVPRSVSSQVGPILREGIPVVLDLRSESVIYALERVRFHQPPIGGVRVEGVWGALRNDSITVLDAAGGGERTYGRNEVSRMWARTLVTKRRTGMGILFGGLAGGGIAWLVREHNGGGSSCGSRPTGDDLGTLIHGVCKGGNALGHLLIAGGISVGSLVGGVVGHRIRRTEAEWVLVSLPVIGADPGGRIQLGYSIPSR